MSSQWSWELAGSGLGINGLLRGSGSYQLLHLLSKSGELGVCCLGLLLDFTLDLQSLYLELIQDGANYLINCLHEAFYISFWHKIGMGDSPELGLRVGCSATAWKRALFLIMIDIDVLASWLRIETAGTVVIVVYKCILIYIILRCGVIARTTTSNVLSALAKLNNGLPGPWDIGCNNNGAGIGPQWQCRANPESIGHKPVLVAVTKKDFMERYISSEQCDFDPGGEMDDSSIKCSSVEQLVHQTI
uniref:Uncharacterized protein n=1 Tax=Romanomermis culicivorax TaxID=13658 RepID=A0A915IXJ3_ROMCU